MAKKTGKGDWIDASGNIVPVKYVKPVDKKRDALVEKLVSGALVLRDQMLAFKEMCDKEIDKYLNTAAKEAGLKENPGGNYLLTGFSGDKQAERQQASVIEFNERLQFAKVMVDKCLEAWSEGANGKLKTVIFDAFKVDMKGKVDTKRILGLRKLNIQDDEWKQAMDLIAEALTVTGKRPYLRFRMKNANGEWETIRLDLSAL